MIRRHDLLLVAVFLSASALPAAAGEPSPERKVHAAGAQMDTLSSPSSEVFRVAIQELERSKWKIERADTAQGRIVTHWKKMDHALARLMFGSIMARCVVDVRALSAESTELSFRGGLAGPEDLDRAPAFGAATAAYRKASARWMGRVRASLASVATATPPGAR